MPYAKYNPNPYGRNVGDCVVRAIAKATGKSWEKVYMDICLAGFIGGDMPSANEVWGNYLRGIGFERKMIPEIMPDDYSVANFADDNPNGTFILALHEHVVCIQDGYWYDTWNSGDKIPLYFWRRKTEEK